MKLTKLQKKILDEIQHIRNIAYEYRGKDNAITTITLEIERGALIRNRVLLDCLLIEEAMSLIIMDYILQDSSKWRTIKYFGRIKRFLLFYDDILAHIPPFQKLDALKKIITLPKKIENTMRKIFNLRNIFSHVYTIDYTKLRRVQYNGGNIFNIGKFEKYIDDSSKVIGFLLKRIKF